jgi:hypothetical protein
MNARTEEAALKTRCCGPEGCGERTVSATYTDPTGDKIEEYATYRTCVGSKCMAWKLVTMATSAELPDAKLFETHIVSVPAMGVCGLARN